MALMHDGTNDLDEESPQRSNSLNNHSYSEWSVVVTTHPLPQLARGLQQPRDGGVKHRRFLDHLSVPLGCIR